MITLGRTLGPEVLLWIVGGIFVLGFVLIFLIEGTGWIFKLIGSVFSSDSSRYNANKLLGITGFILAFSSFVMFYYHCLFAGLICLGIGIVFILGSDGILESLSSDEKLRINRERESDIIRSYGSLAEYHRQKEAGERERRRNETREEMERNREAGKTPHKERQKFTGL